MNTTTKEISYFRRFNDPSCDDLAKGEGSKLHSTYFEFNVTLPTLASVSVSEISDTELLVAADKAGTFDFLKSPEEDGYNDLLSSRE